MKRRQYEKRQKQQGFTLIELLIVIVILGLLVGLVGPRMFRKVEGARQKTAKAQIELLCTAIDTFRLDMRRLPKNLDELVTKVDDPRWEGPYLPKKVPLDPWGRPYVYKVPGDEGRDYDIISYGLDGTSGGDGENKDITSWESLEGSAEAGG
ncbi:MAG: type II secretion system major pseudopilin GspG [Desulfobacterota bacterium]|nr:type II secretion system major pseudopilin GspG [Thermodesulfobacteriota bacterium]